MPQGVAIPLAVAAGSKFIDSIGGDKPNAQAAVPKDLQGLRANQIGLLQYLLGFNQPGMPWSPQPQQLPASMGGPMQRGVQGQHTAGGGGLTPWSGVNNNGGMTPWGNVQPNINPGSMGAPMSGFAPTNPGAMGTGPMPTISGIAGSRGGLTPEQYAYAMSGNRNMQTAGGGGTGYRSFTGQMANSQAPSGGNDMLGRMESYFGPLGTPTTPLQQQSLGGISQFLNSNPYGQSNDALSQILGYGGQNFFGGAQDAFKDVQGANYFGGAEKAFNRAGGAFGDVRDANYFGNAQGVFNRLENFNPFGAAQGSLEGMLGTNPGQGMLDALRPSFERNLAAANQQGGRFGSANAILRSRAVDDYNLLGAQALQRGVDQQQNAANILGMIGNSLIGARNMAGQGMLGVGQGQLQQGLGAAQGLLGVGQGQLGVGQGRLSQGLGAAQGLLGVGQGRSSYDLGLQNNKLGAANQLAQNQGQMFGNLAGAYGIGSAQAQQEAQRQQQAMQILSGLLGSSFGPTFGAPTVVSPSGGQQAAQIGAGISPYLIQALAQGGGGGGGSFSNPGAYQPGFGIPYGF